MSTMFPSSLLSHFWTATFTFSGGLSMRISPSLLQTAEAALPCPSPPASSWAVSIRREDTDVNILLRCCMALDGSRLLPIISTSWSLFTK